MLGLCLLKKIMRTIKLIQHNYKSYYAVYAFDNFLKKDYLKILLEKTISLTQKDTMKNSTNVKGVMTSYDELINHEEYQEFFDSVIEHTNYCIKLRTPHVDEKMEYRISDAWGMQHTLNDYTKTHTHDGIDFAASFCLRNTDESTHMYFEEFENSFQMKANQLIFFPGKVKHSVNAHTDSKTSRVSIGLNILTKYI